MNTGVPAKHVRHSSTSDQLIKRRRVDEREKNLKLLFSKQGDDRFILFPIQSQSIWKFYKQAQRLNWTAEEIDLSADIDQFQKKLTDDERHYIKYVLGFFASSDGIVNENLVLNVASKITLPEARCFYMFQMAIENVHAEMYSAMIESLVRDANERTELFNAIKTIPCIAMKAKWALRYINESTNFAEIIVAFAAVEGIFFSASFCAIYWLKKRGLMSGLCSANELIRRDEGLHQSFACHIGKDMIYENEDEKLEGYPQISKAQVYEIIKDAVECEKNYVNDSLPVSLIGLNNELMSQYVEFVADNLLNMLDCEKLWGTPNPFEWMELTTMMVKNNIHERTSTEYSKSLVDLSVRLDGGFD